MSKKQELSTILIDVESQYYTKPIVGDKLKGILKQPTQEPIELDLRISVFKTCFTIFIVIISTPIIISDLYFGFTDTSCSNKEPNELSISIKIYLLVSGFMSIVATILLLVGIRFTGQTDKINDANCCFICCGGISILLMSVFCFIWNILGAIVFWGYIYGKENCNKTFSTYVFVSLIIKLTTTFLGITINEKEDKK